MILVVKFHMNKRSDSVVHISQGQNLNTQVNCTSDFTFLGLEDFMFIKCTKMLTEKQL